MGRVRGRNPGPPRGGALRVRGVARLALQPRTACARCGGRPFPSCAPRPPRAVAVLAFSRKPHAASVRSGWRQRSRCPPGGAQAAKPQPGQAGKECSGQAGFFCQGCPPCARRSAALTAPAPPLGSSRRLAGKRAGAGQGQGQHPTLQRPSGRLERWLLVLPLVAAGLCCSGKHPAAGGRPAPTFAARAPQVAAPRPAAARDTPAPRLRRKRA